MKHPYRLLALFLTISASSFTALAQAPPAPAVPVGTGSLTGLVLDSLKKEPVPYATVVLLPPAPNDKAITGIAADDNGRFSFTKLAPGPARLRVSYVGYGTQTREVTITAGATDVGTFRLPTAGTALAEAVVIGTKPVVEVRPDRIVYNADQDVTNAGGTAADVLRKAPLLAVDGDGNVKMRGSGNFKVLVNNKPSPTLASNLAEALKGIPAEQIQSVEIITTPPAKYDGEGTAGIINIVLKKGVDRGLNGRVSAAGGNRNSNANASLNFKKGKVGFTSSLGTGAWYGPNEFERTRVGKLDNSTLLQRGDGNYNGRWQFGTVGIDYDLSEKQSLSLAGSLNNYRGSNFSNLLNDFVVPGSPQDNSLFTRTTENLYGGFNGELTATYTKTFAQPKREWSVLGQYANNSGTFGYDFDQYANSYTNLETSQASYRERSRGRTPGSEYTAQTDLVQPFGETQTLETGLKAIWRRTGSVADVDGLTLGDPDFVRLAGRSTDFSYDQNVQAAYATYTAVFKKKLTVSLGSRLERTALSADFQTSDQPFERDYLSLLPNGNAQYTLSENNSVRLAYSRRITRPFIDYLNPFIDRSDPRNIVFGNPELDPELTDSYELSFNTNGKAGSLNISGSVRRTDNAIESIRLPTSEVGVTQQTFRNVASNAYYQLNFYGSAKPVTGWEISGGPDVQYIVRRSPALGIERRGFTAGLNFNSSYKLPKKFTLSTFLYSSLPSPDLQGRGPANLYYQMGVKKTFLKNKADLVLNFGSPFNNYWTYRNITNTPDFRETSESRAFQRSFRLSFAYRFGQEQQGKQRKSISNDDVKGGGNKQGGQ
ncbi:MAG TPA: TonB-dependent receptor [Hymenobacter sp.]|uniref:TonB-dependent receptor domain-containing protein n=1 Tax=Hymenobacter sp. TaxID=1898978 RepID=UPI002ED9E90E